MPTITKKLFAASLAIVCALSLAFPIVSFADSSSTNTENASSSIANNNPAETNPVQTPQVSPADNCTVTIEYYENAIYEEPGIPPNAEGRYLLGTRTLTGITEGTELNAWDYVVNIPGFFFFDGWPGRLTVSTNPDDNIIQLIYFRYSNYSYTVNYYLMTGADLTADSWQGALSPQSVEFHKLRSETFDNRPYGELVQGDTYKYPLDDVYAIDAYPAEIRVGVAPEDNEINVLYVPQYATLPDSVEIPESTPDINETEKPDGTPSIPNTPEIPNPESPSTPNPSDTVENPIPPSNETLIEDQIATLLPNGASSVQINNLTKDEIDELFENFIDSENSEDSLEITDEMLANPVDRETAQKIINAYKTGYENGAETTEAQCAPSIMDHIICIIIIIILAILAVIGFALYNREHRKLKKLEEQAATVSADDKTDETTFNRS